MPVIYDRFGATGNCQGCGAITNWFINGFYPICPHCMLELVNEVRRIVNDACSQRDSDLGSNSSRSYPAATGVIATQPETGSGLEEGIL
jgi:predicted amidophosphoribosyltransferase